MHYYQFNIADYRKDTSHLTPLEHYIYRTLIDWYYLDELPIPKETPSVLRRLCLAAEFEPQLLNVLNDFFTLQESWYHLRIENEIAAYNAQIEHASKAGKASAIARLNKKPTPVEQPLNTRSTTVQPTINHKPITINQTKTSSATKVACPAGVSLNIWNDYLTLRRSKKLPITETALSGIAREAEKANLTLEQTITICCERGWGGFSAKWLEQEAVKQKEKDNQAWRTDDTLMVKKANELKVNTKGKTRFELIAAIDMKMREL